MTTYELKIGFSEKSNQNWIVTIVHHEYFSANTLNAAKSRATRKMKALDSMVKYRDIKWDVWSKSQEHKPCCWVTNKHSKSLEKTETIGFCQLDWESRQMSLFSNEPTPA